MFPSSNQYKRIKLANTDSNIDGSLNANDQSNKENINNTRTRKVSDYNPKKDKKETLKKQKPTSNNILIPKTTGIPTLVLKQFAEKPIIDFGKVSIHSETPHSLELRISNPTTKEQDLSIEKLPTLHGFTVREVMFRIPPKTSNYDIKIFWQPKQPGKVSCQVLFLWDFRFRLPVALIGEAIDNKEVVNETKRTSIVKEEAKIKDIAECDTPNVINRDVSILQSTSNPKFQKLSGIVNNTKLETSKIQKSSKMKQESVSRLNKSKSIATSIIEEKTNTAILSQKKIIRSTAREEIQKIKEKQRELENLLPMTLPQMSQELRNLGYNITKQISPLPGYKDIRISALLQWIQLVLDKYGECLPSKYKIWSFSARCLKEEEEIVFNLISNQYRQPEPLPLSEILPREEDKEVLHHLHYDNRGNWVASFSPTKIKQQNKDLDSMEYDEHKMVQKLSQLFVQLFDYRENTIKNGSLAVLKGWLLGHALRNRFSIEKKEIVSCQSYLRRYLARKKFICFRNERILQMYSAASTLIQSPIRGYHSRYQLFASKHNICKLQSIIRGKLCRRSFNESKSRITQIQSAFRGHTCREDTLNDKYDIYLSQALIRGYLERRQMIEEYTEILEQQHYYEMMEFERYIEEMEREYKNNVTILQSLIRQRLALKKKQQLITAVNTIQATLRMYCWRKSHIQFRGIIIACQSHSRRFLECSKFNQSKSFVLDLQALVRGYLTKKKFIVDNSSVIIYQSKVRGLLQKMNSISETNQIVNIQTLIRMFVNTNNFLNENHRVLVFQALVRNFLSNENASVIEQRIIICQSTIRRHLSLLKRSNGIQTTKFIQASIRGGLERKLLLSKNCDVTIMQSLMRNYLSRREVYFSICRLTLCQASIYGYHSRNDFENERKRAEILQSIVKGFVERKFFVAYKNKASQLNSSATIIQKLFRGFKVRRNNAENINKIRERIEQLNQNSDERMKLKNRTQRSLDVLLKSNSVNQVMRACANLAVTTKWSDNCCESLVTNGAVPILYNLIKSCNRSKPHLELLTHILDILIHLSRLMYLNCFVYEKDEYFDVLFEQLQMYRDKEEIFMRAMTILKKSDTKRLKAVKEGILNRCNSLSKVMERKYTSEKKYAQAKQSISNLNTSLNSSMISKQLKQQQKPQLQRSILHNGQNTSAIVYTYEALLEFIEILKKIK
ncbi:hypothetical protein ABK040_014751 [Willaertia magna]